MNTTVEIPTSMQDLPKWGEYPVPFWVKWIEDKPDFRVVNGEALILCHKEKLCGNCGKRRGEFSWFIGGPQCMKHHIFVDPPLHLECARFAVSICPFINGERREYSARPQPKDALTMPMDKPEKLLLMKTRSGSISFGQLQNHGLVFAVSKDWLSVEELP